MKGIESFQKTNTAMIRPDLPSIDNEIKTMKRKVRFNRKVSMHLVSSHREFSEQEIQRMWISHDEYEVISSNNSTLIRMMNMYNSIKDNVSTDDDDNGICFRGLMHETARRRRTRHRRRAIESVLQEQQRQYMSGIFDDEKLRETLSLNTKAAVQEAIERAQEDRVAILDKPISLIQHQAKQTSYHHPTLASALSLNTNIFQPQQKESFIDNNMELSSLLDDALSVLEAPAL